MPVLENTMTGQLQEVSDHTWPNMIAGGVWRLFAQDAAPEELDLAAQAQPDEPTPKARRKKGGA